MLLQFQLQNTSFVLEMRGHRSSQGVCVWVGGGGGAHSLHPPPRHSNVSRPDPKLRFLSEEVAISRQRITSWQMTLQKKERLENLDCMQRCLTSSLWGRRRKGWEKKRNMTVFGTRGKGTHSFSFAFFSSSPSPFYAYPANTRHVYSRQPCPQGAFSAPPPNLGKSALGTRLYLRSLCFIQKFWMVLGPLNGSEKYDFTTIRKIC